ncbi:hypothetical protein [Alkaliphilus serpentinus]|uniref:J domain-containing protein n=1 Tax=Alkaliphilus serpentinus TaxID=1482731 RepID=A0A833M7X9_9FIRM|nr:hypothetical protein [Alkaliphilus serpentinus]KAB3529586.1 hypothetical protein F8153_09020 [Alkaliphilus serpentinus]
MREKVLEFLKLPKDDQTPNLELLEKLRRYRAKIHPDVNPGLEAIFTEKSAMVNILIDDYKKYIEEDLKNNSIVLYSNIEEKDDSLRVFELLALEEKIKNLETELIVKNNENQRLKSELKTMTKDLEEKKVENFKYKYEYSIKDYVFLSTKVGLTTLILVLMQITEISNIVRNLVSIPSNILNSFLIFYIAYCVASYATKNFISTNLDSLFKSLESVNIRGRFAKYIDERKEFSKIDISEFISIYLEKEYKILNILLKFDIHNRKHYIIHLCTELLTKEFIRDGIIKYTYRSDFCIKFSTDKYKYNSWEEIVLDDVF